MWRRKSLENLKLRECWAKRRNIAEKTYLRRSSSEKRCLEKKQSARPSVGLFVRSSVQALFHSNVRTCMHVVHASHSSISFMRWSVPAFLHSYSHACIHSLINYYLVHWFVHWFIDLLIPQFIDSSIHWLIYSLIDLLIDSLSCSYSCSCSISFSGSFQFVLYNFHVIYMVIFH